MRTLEFDSAVKAEVAAERHLAGKRRTMDDLIYMLLGDMTPGNILVMLFAIVFFGATPAAMLLLFGTYSDGMRWLIGLGLVTAMGFVALYIMRMGLAKEASVSKASPARTEYPGDLTKLTEAFDRAAEGYAYSQQVIRERLCDIMISKEAQARDVGEEEITGMLEAGRTGILADRVLDCFLRENRRGAGSGAEAGAKGRSKERGERFLVEIDGIMSRIEAMT